MTSNTQVGIFTRVPRNITKTWHCKIVNTNEETLEPNSRCDVSSPVESIILQLNFNSLAVTSTSVFNEADDSSHDRMPFLQQQRQLFADIDSAIQSVVTQYSGRLVDVAKKQGLSSIEVPNKRSTTYTMAAEPTSAPGYHSRVRDRGEPHSHYSSDEPSTLSRRVQTVAPSDIIFPSDSASLNDSPAFNVEMLVRAVTESIANDSRGRKQKRGKSARTNRSRSRSQAPTVVSRLTGYGHSRPARSRM